MGHKVSGLCVASMERILQENEALDSIIQRYLDNQTEVTQKTRTLSVSLSLCHCSSGKVRMWYSAK